ncbi:MAG: tRNA-uridine aminocarboxypropyltransferase [Polyangiaceae bacterium]
MGQRSKRAPRCDGCRMHCALCLCAEIPQLELLTRVVLIMHHREASRTTATGPLALLALKGSRLCVHGELGTPLDLSAEHVPGRRVLLLFPRDDAAALTPELVARDPRPVTLLVPDGNWRQASRASRRIPGVAQAECVTLAPGSPTRYRLRHEPKAGGLATFEAIARALGVLESGAVQQQLEALFERMVAGTLSTRAQPKGTACVDPGASAG